MDDIDFGLDANTKVVAEENVAVGITIQSQVNARRTIVMQTAISRDLPARDFHALVDKLSVVSDRQEAKFDLEGVKLSLEADQKGLEQATTAFQNVETKNAAQWKRSNKKGSPVLTDAEEQAKINFATNVKAFKLAIEKKQAEIKELEAKIAKVD